MIPRVMHQVWLGGEPLPGRYRAFIDGFKRLHPGWEHRLWRDDDMAPEWRPLIAQAKTLAAAANVARFAIVREHGGVYADLDFEFNQALDPFLAHRAFAGASRLGYVPCGLFGAEPRHPVLEWVWSQLPAFVGARPPWGPVLLTWAVHTHYGTGFHVAPPDTFYPYEWDEPKRPASDFPGSVAVHHWDHTWKDWRKKGRGES